MNAPLREPPLLVILTCLIAALPAEALIIYRLGGEQLEPPVEAGEPGVEFIQLAWEDVDPEAGAQVKDVDVSPRAIGALLRDPEFNIAPTAENNGGIYIRDRDEIWDGDNSTVWVSTPYLCAELKAYWFFCEDDFGSPGTANIVLPGLHRIDRVRIISGLNDASRTVSALRVYVGIEEPWPGRPVEWHPRPYNPWIVEIRDNREQVLDIPLPAHGEVGFLQVALGEHAFDDWEVHDIEIYATGYASHSIYSANIIDFGKPMTWGDLRWSGGKGEKANVVIQTRTGTDADPRRFWRYTGRGSEREEVTASGYGRLGIGEKAGLTFDRENWSFWAAYEFGDSLDAQVVSPSPRRYFQFRVDFLPVEEDGGEVRFLEFRASEPLATNLVGEVWPVEAKVGVETGFTYAMKPKIASEDAGFDRIEIRSTSLLGAVSDVRVGDVPVVYTVEREEPHLIILGIPRIRAADTGALVEVDFTARVLRYGASFDVRVADGERPLEVSQGANAGDATGQFEGNKVSVATAARGEELLQVRVEPMVITPNGDGANEEARLSYEVLEVTGSMEVGIEIRDLAGRLLRRLQEDPQVVGSYDRTWDGRDEGGQLLPPGIYMAAVSAASDGLHIERIHILHLVY